MDPHLVKYRIHLLLTKGSDEQARRLRFHNHNNEVTHFNDNKSIHRVLKTINYNISFPIEDENDIMIHTINMNDVLDDGESRVTISIPKQNEFLVTKEKEDDETDEYVSYSSSNDDISLTEPNSEK